MLAFDKSDIIEGITVYYDHENPAVSYLLPNTPRFRLDEQHNPVFKFIKYKFPVDRADGKKGGGFVIFDVEFTVPDDVREKVRAKLQENLNNKFPNANPKPQVVLGQLRPVANSTLGRASCIVQLLDSGGALVEKIQNPGAPSLYGNFITPITVELSPEGATLCEQALQGKGGIIQIAYNLPMVVRLPPITARVDFWSSKFMSFHQEVDVGRNIWGTPRSRSERVEEFFSSSEYARVDIDPGMVTDQKVIGAIRDWGWATLEDAVKRMVLKDIDPVKDDDRKVDDSLNHLTRDVMVTRLADFHRVYREGMAMEWDPAPRGTLPNITNIPGVKWDDYAVVVDLDDPFFKQLNLTIQPNVDFSTLPIQSIDVHVEYPKAGGKKEIKDFNFKTMNDVGKFNTFIENNSWKYKYWYQIHYKNMTKAFKSQPIESEETSLTIDVGDTGILTVDMAPGDLDFEQIRLAQVTLHYEPNAMPPIEQQFTLDKDHQAQRFQKVIIDPIDKPYKYKVKYVMKDGKEYLADWAEARSPSLLINDMWSATRTIGVRGRGNFDTDVEVILVDLIYEDAGNDYTQTQSVALDKDNKFFDWSFPVINETGGKITYSGTIKYQNGTEEAIPKTETSDNTLLVGPKSIGILEVQVLPDLIDWDQVKLAKATLKYTDAANSLLVKKDFVFRTGATDPGSFRVELKDKLNTAYEWQATFFMMDGSVAKTTPEMSEEDTLVLQIPT
jgi:hypothetical protein